MKTVILLLLIGLVAVSADVWWEFKRYSTNDCSGEPIQTLEKDSCYENMPSAGRSLKYMSLDKCKENHKIKVTEHNNADCSGPGQPYNQPVPVPEKNDGECIKNDDGSSHQFTCSAFASARISVFVVVVAIIFASL